jgi:hypothetical protein
MTPSRCRLCGRRFGEELPSTWNCTLLSIARNLSVITLTWRWRQQGSPKRRKCSLHGHVHGPSPSSMIHVSTEPQWKPDVLSVLCCPPSDTRVDRSRKFLPGITRFHLPHDYTTSQTEDGSSKVPRNVDIIRITARRRNLKTEAGTSFETLISYHITIWCQPEDGGSMDLRNIGILQYYAASQPRRPWLESPLPWKPQISYNFTCYVFVWNLVS